MTARTAASSLPACTCAVKPESGRAHEPSCPITPLRDEALRRAAEALAAIRLPVRKSA